MKKIVNIMLLAALLITSVYSLAACGKGNIEGPKYDNFYLLK